MFWQFTINGLITGVLYSLLAIGFALVYNTTRIFHIAAAGIYVFAAYMLYLFSSVCGLPLLLAALMAVMLSAALSLAMETTVYRPLKRIKVPRGLSTDASKGKRKVSIALKRDKATPNIDLVATFGKVTMNITLKRRKTTPDVALIASIGIMTVVISTITMIFGTAAKTVNYTLPARPLQMAMSSLSNMANMLFGTRIARYSASDSILHLGAVSVTVPQIIQITCGLMIIIAFLCALKWTNLGTRLRALSNDEPLYETMGHNPQRSRNVLFLISGAFIALASILTVFESGMDATIGMQSLIYAMVAIVIGGMGRYRTCVLGGLLLGIIQSLLYIHIEATWTDAITFLILILMLYLRPQGIAGYKQRTV